MTFAQLQQLSGRKTPAAVKRWLRANNIGYIPDADGKPQTSDAEYDRACQQHRQSRNVSPRLDDVLGRQQ